MNFTKVGATVGKTAAPISTASFVRGLYRSPITSDNDDSDDNDDSGDADSKSYLTGEIVLTAGPTAQPFAGAACEAGMLGAKPKSHVIHY
jgi:hypothetical protein